MSFEWIPITSELKECINDFDCGEHEFNVFIKEKDLDWMNEGYAVTYVAVDDNEMKNGNINRIYAYASINATGLMYSDGPTKYLSCAEIRMFAVSRFLRGTEAVDIDGKRYSYKIFQTLMQEIYHISTFTIGFTAVTLNSNTNGLQLYKKFGFIETNDYLLPEEEEKLNIEGCIPLVFSLISSDALAKIFVEE